MFYICFIIEVNFYIFHFFIRYNYYIFVNCNNNKLEIQYIICIKVFFFINSQPYRKYIRYSFIRNNFIKFYKIVFNCFKE